MYDKAKGILLLKKKWVEREFRHVCKRSRHKNTFWPIFISDFDVGATSPQSPKRRSLAKLVVLVGGEPPPFPPPQPHPLPPEPGARNPFSLCKFYDTAIGIKSPIYYSQWNSVSRRQKGGIEAESGRRDEKEREREKSLKWPKQLFASNFSSLTDHVMSFILPGYQ